MKNSEIKNAEIMELDLGIAQSKNYEDNIERWGDHSDTCLICGKRTNNDDKTRMVHYLTTGNITTDTNDNHPDSQGAFAIGNGCVNRLKKEFGFIIPTNAEYRR